MLFRFLSSIPQAKAGQLQEGGKEVAKVLPREIRQQAQHAWQQKGVRHHSRLAHPWSHQDQHILTASLLVCSRASSPSPTLSRRSMAWRPTLARSLPCTTTPCTSWPPRSTTGKPCRVSTSSTSVTEVASICWHPWPCDQAGRDARAPRAAHERGRGKCRGLSSREGGCSHSQHHQGTRQDSLPSSRAEADEVHVRVWSCRCSRRPCAAVRSRCPG